MLKIPGYKLIEKIADRADVQVYRALDEQSQLPVRLKILCAEFPNAQQIADFEIEFELLRESIGEGIPRALALLSLDKMRVLVLEGSGGTSLAAALKQKDFTLSEKIQIAVSVTKALALLQARGIIHRDLKPENILLSDDRTVQIADFSSARKTKKYLPGNVLSGTLQYFSPEQTGRTQNPVDYRSDYYSLGVTLYELFSGKLPFFAKDEMEWVHCHIAVSERPLHEANTQIPLPLSQIVEKLMKKAPGERYQSALGILRDFEIAAELPNVGEFSAGASDVPSEFRLSSKIYGREAEIKTVNRAVAQVVLGGKRLILVAGDPGVGKSTLVNVVKESAVAHSGYFIFGKYDQFRKDIPFSALIQAFNQLVAQILTEDEASIQEWKERIMGALGTNAGVVLNILPQIELITGKVAEVAPLAGNEQRQRFQQTFHSFIRACSRRGRPLVIFLDDLQWSDSASRTLMQLFLTERDAESLLVIGAYRSGEVTSGHPLRQLLNDFVEKKLETDEIHLRGLDAANIEALINDSFPVAQGESASLARLVFDKTGGNPFFVAQFLKALNDKSLLHFAPFSGWTWDLEVIRREDVTSNVLSLLSDKILALPAETKKLLQLAACFGNYFKGEELKIYNEKSDAENSLLLQPAIEAGLLSQANHGDYKFFHDRVQEAAYKMLDIGERASVHHRIANRLLSLWPPEKIRDGIFYLVNHWNAGSSLVSTSEQREKSAELNLIAAKRAKDSAVYDLALDYADAGISLLNSDDWETYGKLLEPLMMIRATSQYAVSKHDSAEHSFRSVIDHISDRYQKARIYSTMGDLAHVQGRNEDSLRWGLTALNQIGFDIPVNPKMPVLLYMILRTRRLLRKRMKVRQKESVDPGTERNREIINSMSGICAPAYSLNKKLLAYLLLMAAQLSLSEGFLDFGSRSAFCAYLWSLLSDFRATVEQVNYLLDRYDETAQNQFDNRGLFALCGFSAHLVRPYKDAINLLEKANHILTMNGDILYAANSALHASALTLLSEPKLDRTAEKAARYREQCERLGYGLVLVSMDGLDFLTQFLRGEVQDEAALRARLEGCKSPLPMAWYYISRMMIDFMSADYTKAFDEIGGYEMAAATAPFMALTVNMRAISTLIRIKNLPRLKGWEKAKQKWKIRAQIRFFKKLSVENPSNFRAVHLLLLGEWYAYKGNDAKAVTILQAAADAAKSGEILMYEPLANEMLADVFMRRGLTRMGGLCLRDAAFLYERWGAKGKLRSLAARFPEFGLAAADTGAQDSGGNMRLASSQKLDLDTILKATNTLISEIDMRGLVQKLLNILIENAGAERGVLFLVENERLIAKGEISVNTAQEFTLTNIAFDDFHEIPRAMISYVHRTLEPLVLEDSVADERMGRDEYVRRHRQLSTICLPILVHGELAGMVYLENRSAKGVFSPERVELMSILSGQIAISLENAKLYHQQGVAIRMQNELVTAHAVQGMLFPEPEYESAGVHISGYYQPATECGGDWWSYSKIGDWVYVYIGDATGHGAPAALVTSAACSAVSMIEKLSDVTPEKAMEYLNGAICRTTKGQINMTFFVGALNGTTGEFRFVRASHEPPMVLRKAKLLNKTPLRKTLEPLLGENGMSLGASPGETYPAKSVFLEPGDTVVLYTDGLPELENSEGKVLGDRRFWECVYRACAAESEVKATKTAIVDSIQTYRGGSELKDDVTLCLVRFIGAASAGKQAA